MELWIRVLITIVAMVFWYLTQYLLGKRKVKDDGVIHDVLLSITGPLNARLHQAPRVANFLLISSSIFIDLIGVYIIYWSLVGPSFKPMMSLFFIFFLRQFNQFTTALPMPKGIIWRNPGFPSLFVTYGVSTDLFFSGHTALATLGTLVMFEIGNPFINLIAALVLVYEVIVVLILRAHYTMDVFTGGVTAYLVYTLVQNLPI